MTTTTGSNGRNIDFAGLAHSSDPRIAEMVSELEAGAATNEAGARWTGEYAAVGKQEGKNPVAGARWTAEYAAVGKQAGKNVLVGARWTAEYAAVGKPTCNLTRVTGAGWIEGYSAIGRVGGPVGE